MRDQLRRYGTPCVSRELQPWSRGQLASVVLALENDDRSSLPYRTALRQNGR